MQQSHRSKGMTRRSFTAGSIASFATFSALAQPVDSVKIIGGFPPGGVADAATRRVAERMSGTYSKGPVIVENRVGAANRIATEVVKNAAPDGKTLLSTPYSSMSLYPHTYPKLGYDPVKDFAPVSTLASFAYALAVGPLVPASVKTVADYVAWARANPKDASFGSPSAGTTAHFLGALLSLNSGVEIKHVPYRGSQPGVVDVLGGQIASMFTPVGDFMQHHRTGKLRVLGTSGVKRSAFLPDVPSFAEQGYGYLTSEEWFGIYAPANTPAAIIGAANASITSALRDKAVVDSLATFGLTAMPSTPAEMARSQKEAFDHWGPLIKRIGFTAES